MRIGPAEASLPRSASVEPRPPAPKPSTGEPSSFSRVLQKLGGELDRGEATVHRALGGTSSSDPAALLALQAGIYRYVEAVDLAAKLVDRAAGAVKTTLQSQ